MMCLGIDLEATGRNIIKLRKMKQLSVRDLQEWCGFENPQAIYKWQQGKNLPSIDSLVILSKVFEVSINEILILNNQDFLFCVVLRSIF